MAPSYTAVSLTGEGRDALRRLTAAVTGHLGQRVSMSDALRIAERLAHAHYTEIPGLAIELGITSESA